MNLSGTHLGTDAAELDRLSTLFWVSHELHPAQSFSSVVQVIIEVLLNFVGVSEVILYLLDETGQMAPALAEGRAAEDMNGLADEEASLLRGAITSGEIATHVNAGAPAKVVVPLLCDGVCVGALLISDFLQQKTGGCLSRTDEQICEIFRTRAGAVLQASFADVGAPRFPKKKVQEELR